MGMEAISRGARRCYFVERDRKTSQQLKQNLHDLEIDRKASILCYDYKKALKIDNRYDIVYVDAPYGYYDDKKFVIDLLVSLRNRLNSGARVFIEEWFSKEKELNPTQIEGYELLSSRKHGSSLLHYYQLLDN